MNGATNRATDDCCWTRASSVPSSIQRVTLLATRSPRLVWSNYQHRSFTFTWRTELHVEHGTSWRSASSSNGQEKELGVSSPPVCVFPHLCSKYTQFSDQKQGSNAFSRHTDAITRLKMGETLIHRENFVIFCVRLFRAGLWVDLKFGQRYASENRRTDILIKLNQLTILCVRFIYGLFDILMRVPPHSFFSSWQDK